ncbi:patatin-like phospholipase family protein [Pseudovibrio exalbescens]|uniref:patatin-like phospholipase family protein n=1 Tax=Pseudovibrio exalbescens TaxID=197461 RepID=UPI00236715BD|nr:patatin-like phospholipase family protein [Pseudovibrio exalbescens]MDD7911323.1 patatin-like phospholipase family protein [Pseudovibrio exalbescens]
MSQPRIGVALGGGGARGLSHIPVLQALDDLGLKPHAMSGTSIGALIGTGYAGGMSGDDIHALVQRVFGERNALMSKLWALRPKKISEMFSGSGLMQFNTQKVLEIFTEGALPESLEECPIPMSVITADYYNSSELIIRAGPAKRAVAASIAIPYVFKPVDWEGRVLIDGGVVNPLPFDVLPETCDVVVAVDVVGRPIRREDRSMPKGTESMFGAMQILMQSITLGKLQVRHPDILVRPDIERFQVMDFLKSDEILSASAPVREDVKRKLDHVIESKLNRSIGH